MSAEILAQISTETDARLRSASGSEELRRISLRHVAAGASTLADSVCLAKEAEGDLAAAHWESALIVSAYGGLLGSFAAAFASEGIQDTPLQSDLCDEADRAFLGRLKALFGSPKAGGRMSDSRTVAEIAENNAETVRVALVEVEGRGLCGVCILADYADRGDRRPTRKGICIKVGMIPEFIAALKDAEQAAAR